jgi:hypothetical protein
MAGLLRPYNKGNFTMFKCYTIDQITYVGSAQDVIEEIKSFRAILLF